MDLSIEHKQIAPSTGVIAISGKLLVGPGCLELEALVPKLQAIAQARGGSDERIYVRGDKTVNYGTVMKVMGRLSAAGFRRVALVTEVEQGP